MTYPLAEHSHAILGVEGCMYPVPEPELNAAGAARVHRSQEWVSCTRPIEDFGTNAQMRVTARFDDQCGNGHQTFSITAEVRTDERRRPHDIAASGCLHDEIADVFPELEPLIKWHLVSTDGPLHYIANTTYLAGNLDHNGLHKDEAIPMIGRATGKPLWDLRTANGKSPVWLDTLYSGDEPPATPVLKWVPAMRVGEGKERQLDDARLVAVWPDATPDQLCLPRAQLTLLLQARLPALIERFKHDMTQCGFLWELGVQP